MNEEEFEHSEGCPDPEMHDAARAVGDAMDKLLDRAAQRLHDDGKIQLFNEKGEEVHDVSEAEEMRQHPATMSEKERQQTHWREN